MRRYLYFSFLIYEFLSLIGFAVGQTNPVTIPGLATSLLSTPGAATPTSGNGCSTSCSGGTCTTWQYAVIALDAAGGNSQAGLSNTVNFLNTGATKCAGETDLSATTYVKVVTLPVAGATSCVIYRSTPSFHKLGPPPTGAIPCGATFYDFGATSDATDNPPLPTAPFSSGSINSQGAVAAQAFFAGLNGSPSVVGTEILNSGTTGLSSCGSSSSNQYAPCIPQTGSFFQQAPTSFGGSSWGITWPSIAPTATFAPFMFGGAAGTPNTSVVTFGSLTNPSNSKLATVSGTPISNDLLMMANATPDVVDSGVSVANVTGSVNSIQITPSVTGSPVKIGASGSDANINLNLLPKGTGVVQVNPLATGGTVHTVPVNEGTGAIASVGPGITGQLLTANNAADPSYNSPGVPGRTVSGAFDTIQCDNGATIRDRAATVQYTTNAAVAVTLPQAGSSGCASNFAFGVMVTGTGPVTITPTTSTISYCNGYSCTTAASSLVLPQGSHCTISSPDNANYIARCSGVTQLPNTALANSSTPINGTTCTLGTACNLGQLNDTNGKATVKSTATPTAVDWLDITNGATGNPGTVTVDAAGSDTSVSLVLKSKGANGVVVEQAGIDSTQAVQLLKADGVTTYGSFDSVNKRFRIGDNAAPTQTFDVAGVFSINSSGTVPRVANVGTVGLIGIAADLGTVDITGRSSDFNGTTGQAFFVPSGASGTYRVSVYAIVTTAAGTGSTLPSTCVLFTERDNNVAAQVLASASSVLNSTAEGSSATVFVDAKQSTNIQIASGLNCTGGTAYSSTGTGPMQFKVRAKVEGM